MAFKFVECQSLRSQYIYEKTSHTYILELLDTEEHSTEFCFRKLEFDVIYNAYSNKSPFMYYISVFGGLRPCFFCLCRRGSKIWENMLI